MNIARLRGGLLACAACTNCAVALQVRELLEQVLAVIPVVGGPFRENLDADAVTVEAIAEIDQLFAALQARVDAGLVKLVAVSPFKLYCLAYFIYLFVYLLLLL